MNNSLLDLIGYQPEIVTKSKTPPPEPDDPAYITPPPKHRRVTQELSTGETITMSAIAASELEKLKSDSEKWQSISEDLLTVLRFAVDARNSANDAEYDLLLSRYRRRMYQFLAAQIESDEHKRVCTNAHKLMKEFYAVFLDKNAADLDDDPTGDKHLAIAQTPPTPPDDLNGEPLPHPNWDRSLGGELFEQHFSRGSHFRKTYLHQIYFVNGEEKTRFLGEKK